MNDNKEFIDMLLQNKRIIYKICFMYARDNDDINDLPVGGINLVHT